MTEKTLIVASDTVAVLSTAGPIPTDSLARLPAHRCSVCGVRWRDDEPHLCGSGRAPVSDGPFPFTVAVWQQDPEAVLLLRMADLPLDDAVRLGLMHGQVVASVEVTGPSHEADDCFTRVLPETAGQTEPRYEFCHPDASPDGWHTPVGEVTRLDPPIPHERPMVYSTEGFLASLDDGRDGDLPPASAWWADLEVDA